MSELTVTPTAFLTLNYRLVLPNGEDYINTFEDSPATMQLGTGQFAPCFEKAFMGAKVGEKRSATISCQELFRGSIDRTAIYPREIIKESLARNASSLIVAHNHPLAGKDLSFEAEIVAIL